jgi:NaMN:DMB phosphoribosyltransferase
VRPGRPVERVGKPGCELAGPLNAAMACAAWTRAATGEPLYLAGGTAMLAPAAADAAEQGLCSRVESVPESTAARGAAMLSGALNRTSARAAFLARPRHPR